MYSLIFTHFLSHKLTHKLDKMVFVIHYSVFLLSAAFYNINSPGSHTHTRTLEHKNVLLIGWSTPFVNMATHTSCVSGLHANGSVQSDDLSINHGVLSQRCHQVGKLSGVSQAWGEGHLAGKKGAHLLWKTSQEGSGEQTWRRKHWTIRRQCFFDPVCRPINYPHNKCSLQRRISAGFTCFLFMCVRIHFNKYRNMFLSPSLMIFCIFLIVNILK